MEANQRIQDTLIGGDSYCYVTYAFPVGVNNVIHRFLKNEGKYPMYEISIDIVDLNKFSKIDFSKPPSIEEINRTRERIYIGTLGSHGAVELPSLEISPQSSKQDYNIFVSARNGRWTQSVRLRKIDDRWKLATRITKDDKVLLKRISKDFPTAELDWK